LSARWSVVSPRLHQLLACGGPVGGPTPHMPEAAQLTVLALVDDAIELNDLTIARLLPKVRLSIRDQPQRARCLGFRWRRRYWPQAAAIQPSLTTTLMETVK
jgi:hypothetical protein